MFFNERFMASARHEERCLVRKRKYAYIYIICIYIPTYFLVFAKKGLMYIKSNDDAGGVGGKLRHRVSGDTTAGSWDFSKAGAIFALFLKKES